MILANQIAKHLLPYYLIQVLALLKAGVRAQVCNLGKIYNGKLQTRTSLKILR